MRRGGQPSGVLDAELTIRLPADGTTLGQDEEWCEVGQDGSWRRIRFHDYGDIYAVPGLYERLFHDLLRCTSPETVVGQLAECLAEDGADPAALRGLDLGAGNGLVGAELRAAGIGELIGIDIVPEAGTAAQRDRPGVYSAYHVCDLLQPSPEAARSLDSEPFDVLACVAALGFGDIPPPVFARGLELVRPGGWVALTIKESFLEADEPSGFARFLGDLERAGELEVLRRHRYLHRLTVAGEPLHYVAMVARKR
jgi:hypothetical protein